MTATLNVITTPGKEKKIMRILGLLAGAASVVALSVAAAVPAVAESTIRDSPCGFYKTSNSAFYNHCGQTRVLIHLDEYNGKTSQKCVQPGETYLGRSSDVENAYHIGAC